MKNQYFKDLKIMGDFSGGPVVKNPPSHGNDKGSIPDRKTKTPPAREHLSKPGATAREFLCHNWKILHDAVKIPRSANKTLCSQINRYNFKKR